MQRGGTTSTYWGYKQLATYVLLVLLNVEAVSFIQPICCIVARRGKER